MGNYYCIVAGLPDVAFDGSKPAFSVERFKEEIYPMLSKRDARCMDVFFLARDNANILNILRYGENAEMDALGRYSREELEEIIESAKNGDIRNSKVPAYIYDFFDYYTANETRENVIWEDVLASFYYEYAIKCPNKFISAWFEYNLNVNNILVAVAARKYKLSVSDAVVGDNEIAETLRTSGARDFGLSGTLEYVEDVLRLCENNKLQEREHKLDEMRWEWLDENSVFDYFSIERLFVFLQKLTILERWGGLDEEAGTKRYKEMIEALKSGIDALSVEVK